MVPKLHFPTSFSFYSFLAVFILFFYSKEVNAQCAGNDNVMLTVCDIANPSSKTVNLYSQLGGTPTAGGTWNDDDNSGGLNKTTGVLNAQQIKRSGIYHYTYTVTGVSGCIDNTATVTVTIGGYTGIPAPTASICSSETAYNLFQVFEGIPSVSPQINGTWHDDDNSGGLNTITGTLNASIPVPDDNYSYTYSIGAIGSCPAPPPSKVYVAIYRSPKPGTPSNLSLCSDQVSGYTSVDLNSRISGADPGGIWSETTTSEISGPTDSTIDIQNIYNTKGAGVYSFTYTVSSNNTVCSSKSSTVFISIGKQLDFTGATLTVTPDICENYMTTTNYTGILTQGTEVIADGQYEVTYSISGVGSGYRTRQNFSSGMLVFPIPTSNFQQVRDYTISITNITFIANPVNCPNIIGTIQDVLHIYPNPKINSATLTIPPVCQTFDAIVNFSGTSNLSDGNYDIIYNLSGSNLINGVPASLAVTGGLATFNIPSLLIPKVGTTTISIVKITNSITGCTSTSTLKQNFVVNPSLDMTNLTVTIKDICQGQPANIKLAGLGTLTNVSITYDISGANTVNSKTIPLTVVSGQTSFDIPTADVTNPGITNFTITNIVNDLTGCSLALNKKTNFTVTIAPNIPTANDQIFCSSDNPTVASLQPKGSQYRWFDSATSTVPLASTTPLVTGNYFVKEVGAITGCESGLKMIAVQNNPTPQIDGATVSIAAVCQSFEVKVDLTNSNVANGNYDVLYNLSGSNIANAVPAVLTVANKFGSFIIPKNLVPNVGTSTVAITKITNPITGCSSSVSLSKSFTVNPLPDISKLVVTIKNTCQGQPATIKLSGLGNLTAININYSLAGANSVPLQTIPLTVVNGDTSFVVSETDIVNLGLTTFTMTDITNTVTGCPLPVNIKVDFTVTSVPNKPVANNQAFCEIDNATVASLAPSGNQYNWYNSATSTTPLPLNTPLTTGKYYIKGINSTTSCESQATTISVQVNSVQIPVLKPNGDQFCGINKPTILNLSNNTTASANLAWYDAVTNGTVFSNTHLLQEGVTYYGLDYDATTKCYSSPLSVTVSLTACNVTPDGVKIPDGFSPNGDGVNDTFQIVDIEFSFPNYTLEIFNRYGNILFKGDINKPAWDGKNSNSSFISGDAPTGVYFYIINYNKNNQPPKQGQLYLNR